MNREQSPIQAIFDAIDETTKQSIERSPAFMYKGKMIRLDYVSKADRLFLNKVFEEIETNKNEEINFDKLKKEAEQEVLDIQKHMAKIQSKKIISVKEFTDRYGVSKTSQQDYRGRLRDPLPHHQKVRGGKITYIVEEVEQWLENQHK